MTAEKNLDELVSARLDGLREVMTLPQPMLQRLEKLALVSDFAIETLLRQPQLLGQLDESAQPVPLLQLPDAQSMALLRRWRCAESSRLIWRDISDVDDVGQTLRSCTLIAEQAIGSALDCLERDMFNRHGQVIDPSGQPVGLVVFGLGKLGGAELNFSSDVDLIYAFARQGLSDGVRPLDAEVYFTRIGQRLAQFLGDITADGFSHRVDLRLRPFGSAGRIALSFAAMEQYFQTEGRDWERYAWIKARPVAGDYTQGERLLSTLSPFVYRRYLDYTALDGLREMKALIAQEVERKELADDIKRGPGGIREIEFLAQALQLIRGGREPELQQRSLSATLDALARAGHMAKATAQRMNQAYRFFRRLENRLQMLSDAQTHELPSDVISRLRIARGLDFVDSSALERAVAAERAVVQEEFSALLHSRRRVVAPSALAAYWKALPDNADAKVLAEAGFDDAEHLHQQMCEFAGSGALRQLSARGRARFDSVVPTLLAQAAQSDHPQVGLAHGLALLQAISKRTSYLALLQEQPAALDRLVSIALGSALLSERLCEHPILLDELLDLRAAGPVPGTRIVAGQINQLGAQLDIADVEASLLALAELRQSLTFRIGLAYRVERMQPIETVQALATLAEGVLDLVIRLARRQVEQQHGRVDQAGFAVVGYGSIGGSELGFSSDLDLVFLHNAPPDRMSDGPRPIEAARYFARLAQKIVAQLDAVTGAGTLYEVDVRLRPDGTQGMLVSTMESFAAYQRERAWTWEQQALVRAKLLYADQGAASEFEQIRTTTLSRKRDPSSLQTDVQNMRAKMRAELDRSRGDWFDLKQGSGGLVDIEFLMQQCILQHAREHAALCEPRSTVNQIAMLAELELIKPREADELRQAHELMIRHGLDCTLDRRPRLVRQTEVLKAARTRVQKICRHYGWDDESPAHTLLD